MKKIILGEVLKVEMAICNFCGKADECVRGSSPVSYLYYKSRCESIAILDIDKHFKTSFFGNSYYKVPSYESKARFIYDSYDGVVKELDVHICKNCVTQLSALMK